jgi:hypothetical protein
MIRNEKLKELYKLAKDASPSPWLFHEEVNEPSPNYLEPAYCEPAMVTIGENTFAVGHNKDAALIVANRELVVDMIEELIWFRTRYYEDLKQNVYARG